MLLQVCGCCRRLPLLLPVFPVVGFFSPWGRQPCLQSLQAVCMRLAGGCVSVFGKPPAPPLPRCSVWLRAADGRHWLVSSLPGVLPRPCLSVCLPVCFGLPVRPSVSLCHLAATALPSLIPSVPFARPQTDTIFFFFLRAGSWQRSSHARAVISVNISHRGMADSRPCLLVQMRQGGAH